MDQRDVPGSGRWRDSELGADIFAIHAQLSGFCPQIRRVAVAIYDDSADVLRTFIRSVAGGDEFDSFECTLTSVPSLQRLAKNRQIRVIDDLSELVGVPSEHRARLLASGYRSSLTVPLDVDSQFLGFLFFDADETGVFTAPLVAQLDVYSRLIALLVAHERIAISTLLSAARSAVHFSRFRDEETGAHLARMSRYAKLIAAGLPEPARPSDECIEYLLHFAPLHDVGKIAVPDEILRKPGKLTEQEHELMRTHVSRGAALIDAMMQEFGLGNLRHANLLRNIILYHHENYDGTGYGMGLSGTDIPIEARITKVADVFDALTSKRPYKEAWSLDEAFSFTESHAGGWFDPDCATALLEQRDKVIAIRNRFRDEVESAGYPPSSQFDLF